MTDIYLNNPYLTNLTTTVDAVTKVKKKLAISLKENIFYPGGGGQPADRGFIKNKDVNIFQVSRILKISGKTFLVLPDCEKMTTGDSIYSEINWNRRYQHMRCHSAAHVLMGVIKREIENYRPQGIEISELGETVTVRFNGSWSKTFEDANIIIEKANKKIVSDLSLTTKNYLNIENAIQEYEHIYRGPKLWKGPVRIVIIDNFDANPCGGTHVKKLKEISEIKLQDFDSSQLTVSLKTSE